MNSVAIDHYSVLRLTCFIGIFLAMATWERIVPRLVLRSSRRARWFVNLSLTFVNGLTGRLVFPIPPTILALLAEEQSWGLFHAIHMPSAAAGLISLVFLDLCIYLQHLVFHKISVFWFIHSMHHTDLDIDVTTGTRFHPIEIILSLLIKMAIIVLVGIPAWSVLVFEILLNSTSMFNHSNVSMNAKADSLLRLVLVTPDMHRVHHSVIIREHDSNFGFNLSWWDRIFGTYRDQPGVGHDNMVIGLANFRNPGDLSFFKLLALPFTRWKKL